MGKANGKSSINDLKSEKRITPAGNWLSRSTASVSPLAAVSFLILLVAALRPWEYSRDEVLCEIARTGISPEWQWVEIPRAPNKTNYLAYPAGTFIYRHIYMDTFKEDFDVEPIGYSEVDPSVKDHLDRFSLRDAVLNNTNASQKTIKKMMRASETHAAQLAKWKEDWESGKWVDDGSIYVRWVHPKIRWGMFAGRRFKKGELIGMYTGVYDRDISDVEYAWEYNYLVQVKDENGQNVRAFIDAKHRGNYARFANHRDDDHHDQQYTIFDNKYHVLYIARHDIEVHDQIFVNYGSGYWETKDKVQL